MEFEYGIVEKNQSLNGWIIENDRMYNKAHTGIRATSRPSHGSAAIESAEKVIFSKFAVNKVK